MLIAILLQAAQKLSDTNVSFWGAATSVLLVMIAYFIQRGVNRSDKHSEKVQELLEKLKETSQAHTMKFEAVEMRLGKMETWKEKVDDKLNSINLTKV